MTQTFRALCALLLVLAAAACGGTRDEIPQNIANPDRFLYDRGMAALKDEKWLNAREYFRQVVDNYPQSLLRPDAKLGIGDAFLGEGSTESLVLAANEYSEFLTFYPRNPRADYAQYKLAMSHYEQMRAPQRDQTETRNAMREFERFFTQFPDSALMPEVKKNWRVARDRLSEHEFGVGLHYFRIRWYPGAIPRFKQILSEDPGYSRKDRVYFYLAESLAQSKQIPEAIPYFERLLAEFVQSEHLDDAKRRLQELKNQ